MIENVEHFVLNKVLDCFDEFLNNKKDENELHDFIEMLKKQAEGSKSIMIILTQIQSFICFDMSQVLQ